MNNQWWRAEGAVVRLIPRHDRKTLREYTDLLPQLAADGIKIIDFFPPYDGGVEYSGLDTLDFYVPPRDCGTLDEMRAFVSAAHALGMRVIAFVNVGYCAEQHPDFLKACRDVKAGVDSRERDMFIWTDEPHEMERPLMPFFCQDTSGEWVFSEAAGMYYWCKWFGTNGNVRLPQYWFGSKVWREECARILRFWLDIGFDGYLVDAVNWYIDCDWDINRDYIINPCCEAGEVFLQPEGAGGFGDDPVTWITEGGYNCVQDYSLDCWWTETSLIKDALQSGDATALWPAIDGFRNRVAEAGGVTYMGLGQGGGLRREPMLLRFETALYVAIGNMVNFNYEDWVQVREPFYTELFRLQAGTPALYPAGKRQLIDAGHPGLFALRCVEGDGAVDAAFNFTGEKLRFDLGGVEHELPPLGFAFIDKDGGKMFGGA